MSFRTLRRWLVAVATTLLIVVGLVACGGSDSESASETAGVGEATTDSASTDASEGAPAVEFVSHETKLKRCTPEPEPGSYTIGWSSPLDSNESLHTMARAMQLETEALGGKFILEDAAGDPDKQVATIQRLINEDADAIVVSPLDPGAVKPVLEQARKAGIQVIGHEVETASPNLPPGYDAQVVQERDRLAYLAAQEMAELVPQGSEIGQINFAVPVPSLEYYTERVKYWAEQFGLKPVAVALDPKGEIAGGEEAMSQLLSEAPDIAGLIAYNDESGTGARSVIRSQGKDIPVVTQNGGDLAYSSIESGVLQASSQIGITGVGICLVRGAYNLLNGEEVPPTVRGLDEPVLLDEDNIDEVPTWDEILEERFGTK